MNRKTLSLAVTFAIAAHVLPSISHAQSDVATADSQSVPVVASQVDLKRGPNQGTLRQINGLQIETLVAESGIRLFVFDDALKPISIAGARGVVSLQVAGNPKRYRYDLLPDETGSLTAPVNLSKITGRQVDLSIQIVGVSAANGRIAFNEVTMVPPSERQLAAQAIARQKDCPVSGKPLGSMGDPILVNVDGRRVYVCCKGCTDAVKANPEKYTAVVTEVIVAAASKDDAELISKQAKCPVMDEPLGSMGQPVKLLVGGKPIFLCCKGCIKKVKADPRTYLSKVYGDAKPEMKTAALADALAPAGTEQVREGVFKVTSGDKPFIALQKRCPVMDEPLDAMGGPYKVSAEGKAIYICCPGCAKSIAAEPKKYLEILAKQGVKAPGLRR